MRNVPPTAAPEGPFLWTRGIAARETLRYLDSKGIDAEPLLSKAELSRGQLSQDSGGISVASQCRFLELAAIETDDSLLGLHLAAEMDPRDIGILFYLTASSATVADGLELLARYVGTTNEAVLVEISRHKVETVLTVRLALEFEVPRRQFLEFIALEVIRALGRVTNREFAPSRITFSHTRNSGLRELHRILRCPVEFACAADSWVLPQSIMELPIVSEDIHLLQILETHADDLLAQRHTAAGLRGLVENQLLSVLPSGRVQAAMVAQKHGMTERSLSGALLRRARLSAKSSTVCGTAWLFVTLKISVLHSNRSLGCSVIRSLPLSIMRSNGGSAHRHVEREVCRPHLHLLSGRLHPTWFSAAG